MGILDYFKRKFRNHRNFKTELKSFKMELDGLEERLNSLWGIEEKSLNNLEFFYTKLLDIFH